jgi:hypothetical protein
LTTAIPEKKKKNCENCGWSGTQQQHSICRISAKHYENEEQVTEKLAKLWLEWNSTTTQKARNKANGE